MSGLTTLDAHFADGHVPLGLLLGTIGALSLVRNALPDATHHPHVSSSDSSVSRSIEPFLALLLGAVAMHDRLTEVVDRARDSAPDGRHRREIVTPDSLGGIAR